jgi:NADPH:quinone reductase-like Zn-dependent oxidoreductase
VKAAFFKEHGGSDKIIYDDYKDPSPDATEVVVRVKACALNHVDMLLLDGRYPPPEGLPHVNGCEVTGTIESSSSRAFPAAPASTACAASAPCACATATWARPGTAATRSW